MDGDCSVLEINRRRESARNTGGSFCHFGTILPTFVNFRHFLGLIFLFLSLFGLRDTVYSRGEVDHV
jgi:hypothetical protein